MTPQLSWVREGERLVLQGELDQDVLNPLWNARQEAMKGTTCIDLHAVSRVDTAGVALLIHLIAQGKFRVTRFHSKGSARICRRLQHYICLRTYCLANFFSTLLFKASFGIPTGLFAYLRPPHFPLRCGAVFTIR
jgi:phospholipid transport system transporter-binding protein